MTGVTAERLHGGQVLRIHLDGGKGNVLTGARMAAITAALADHEDEATLKAVLLTAQGDHFSFGASVEEHRRDRAAFMLTGFHRLIRTLVSYPVPVAIAAPGQCLGGAFELALACTFVFVHDKTRFGCPEVKLGVFPPVLATLGPVRIGAPLAERALLTGAPLSALDLSACGLVTRSFGDADPAALIEGSLAWIAEQLLPLSAFTLRQACQALRTGSQTEAAVGLALDRVEEQYVREVVESHDGNEGIEAFLARRKPVWKDR